MRKMILVLLIVVLCYSGFACVSTPDKDYVFRKDTTQMIEQAKQTPASDAVHDKNEQIAQESTNGSTQTEKRMQSSFTGKTTDEFHVEVDAVVMRPDIPLPIVRVLPDDFDEEMANRFFQVLTEGYDLYSPEQLDTVPALDQRIQEAMDEIANGNNEKPVQDYLNELIEKRKTASDMIGEPAKRVDDEHNKLYSIDGKQSFMFYHNGVNTRGSILNNASISYENRNVCNDSLLRDRVFFRDLEYVFGKETIPIDDCDLSMNPIQAAAYVNSFLDLVGLDDIRVSALFVNSYDNDRSVYIAICDRFIKGIQIAHPYFSSGNYEGSVSPVWGYEQAILCFNDRGIALFQYNAPLKVEDTIVNEANLLPMERIMEQFQNMMCAKYESRVIDPIYATESLTYHITDITLSLQRISEQNNIEYGLLVPVWNFWGYETSVSSYDYQTNIEKHIDGWHGSEPILTINAVDGSVIDPIKGY